VPVAVSTGGSPPRTPASSSSIFTPQLTTDELLARLGGLDVHRRVKFQAAIPDAAMRAWISRS
jgi:hypothetical protein